MSTFIDDSGALVAADIFQVLLCDEDSFRSPPPAVLRNIGYVREAHPWARHHLLGNADIRSFLAAHFEAEVLAAYETLTPNSFRSNLARYAFLLVEGGLYVDIGVRFVSALRAPADVELVAFRDHWLASTQANMICPGVMLAKAGRPEFRTAIDMILAHVKSRFYGAHPTEVSGPGVFARAIAHHHDSARYGFGQHTPVAGETAHKNFVFLTPEGDIVALGKSGPTSDVSYLGLKGVNNYGDIWRARRVYGETPPT